MASPRFFDDLHFLKRSFDEECKRGSPSCHSDLLQTFIQPCAHRRSVLFFECFEQFGRVRSMSGLVFAIPIFSLNDRNWRKHNCHDVTKENGVFWSSVALSRCLCVRRHPVRRARDRQFLEVFHRHLFIAGSSLRSLSINQRSQGFVTNANLRRTCLQ